MLGRSDKRCARQKVIPLGSVEVDRHHLGAQTEPREDRCKRRALIAFGHWGLCVFRRGFLCYLMAKTVRTDVICSVERRYFRPVCRMAEPRGMTRTAFGHFLA